MGATASRYELAGTIASAGFSSGHRFVVGHWDESPLGPMDDVMWARPDGERILLVDRPAVAALVTSVYRFDEVETVPMACRLEDDVLEISAGDLRLRMRAGGRRRRIPLPALRGQPWVRPLERLASRALLGVQTYGVSPTGVREWYRADEYRRVVAAEASWAGRDLGQLGRFHAPARFGFSEAPRSPAMVKVRPLLEDPSGRMGFPLAT